ncbi:MAG: ATP-binding protein [Bacteroidia bacterium]|nr:ATP-binding protein [Bacteroidia bacterium]
MKLSKWVVFVRKKIYFQILGYSEKMNQTLKIGFWFICGAMFSPLLQAQSENIDSLKALYESARSDSLQGHLAHRIAVSSQNQGLRDQQEHWAKISYRHFQSDDLIIPRANSLYTIAASFYYRGIYDSMKPYMEEMEAIGKEREDPKVLGKAYVGLSLMESSLGRFSPSVDYAFQALDQFQTANDSSGLSSILGNIGVLYWKLGNLEKSREYLEKGLLIDSAMGYKWGMASKNSNISTLLVDKERWAEALPYLRKAKTLFAQFGDSSILPHTFINLGNAMRSLKAYDSAFYYLDHARILCQKRNLEGDLDRLYYCYGLTWQDLNEYSKADSNFRVSLLYAEKTDDLIIQRSNHFRLSEVNAQRGLFKEALEELKAYNVLRDSLLNKDRIQQIEELNIRHETAQQKADLAEKELQISRQQNRFYQMLAIGAGIFLLGILLFILYQNKQKSQKREAEMILRLQQAESENLREIDHLKSRFFANISHEFRTPLTLILGPLNQFLSGKVQGEPAMLYRMMKRNAERLLQLINQLLDLSKLEAGRMQLKLIRADIYAFLRVQVGNFESLAESKNIRFHFTIPSHNLIIAFDRDKLEKTITNLLSNAFKFTPEEGDVWFAVEKIGHKLEITIRDNGIGIPEDQLEHIFDRFYQVETDEYEGTGIGLALTKELIELHQGEISVSSELGKGSVFVVKLPIDETSAPLEAEELILSPKIIPTVSPVLPESSSRLNSNLPLLLLVEDNEDVRAYLRTILQSSYKIIEAKNGNMGLECAQEAIPDLIISDVMMPEMDGIQFTRTIKTDTRTSHIPVILLTAKAGRENKLEGLETGADDYLSKPFDEEELRIRVKNLLDQRRRMGAQFGKDIIRLSPEEIMVESADKQFLDRVIRVVETYMNNEDFSIEDMGSEIGLSRSQLHRKIKALTDQSPSVFLRTLRLKRAKQLLEEKAGTSAEISYQVGFGSPAYFSKCFKDQFGVTPGEIE